MENPKQLLRDAQTEMREKQARNRERAVMAVTAKNNFQKLVDDKQKRIDALSEEADRAEKRGDTDSTPKIRNEIITHKTAIAALQKDLEQASALSEQAKKAIQNDEETIRRKTAEALELKAQWENSHIYRDMNRALRALNTGNKTTTDPLL